MPAQYSPASVLYEVEGKFKVFAVAVVWVWDGCSPGVFDEVVGHADDLSALSTVVGLAADIAVVVVVHDHDAVEVSKVVPGIELSRDMVYAVAALCTMQPHALVGQLANVPWSDSCRVDIKLAGLSGIIDVFLHDGIGCRGSADIAQTDEKYLCRVHNHN